MARVHAFLEQVGRRLDVRAHAELPGDLAGDGHVVAGDHFHLEAVLLRLQDRLLRVFARRIVERKNAQEGPGLAVVPGLGDTERAETLGRHIGNGLIGLGRRVGIEVAHAGDDLRGALGEAQPVALLVRDGGLGPFADRIEWREGDLRVALEGRGVLEAADHGQIDCVLVLFLGRQGAAQDAGLGGLVAEDDRVAEGELVFRQGSGLVRAEDLDSGHLLDGLQARDDGLFLGQRQGAQGHGDREHGGHRDRDRSDHQDQHELQDLDHIVPLPVVLQDDVAIEFEADQKNAQADGHDDQEVADTHDGLLGVGLRAGAGDQLGGPAEEGVVAGAGDERDHLALLGDAAGVGRVSNLLVHRQGFAGERGLIDADVVAVDEGHVGGHNLAEPEAHDIARHQPGGIHRRPVPVALDMRFGRQAFLQRRQGVGGLAFLPEADAGVVQQQHRDNDEIDPMLHEQRQDRRHLDHPGDRPPEVAEKLAEQRLFLDLDRVRPVARKALLRLFAAQARHRALQLLELVLDRNRLGLVLFRPVAGRALLLFLVGDHGYPP